MGIKVGNKQVQEIMVGNKIVLDVYCGSQHVYEREPRTSFDGEDGELFVNDTLVISDDSGNLVLSRDILKGNN